jgi:hypothetical protein
MDGDARTGNISPNMIEVNICNDISIIFVFVFCSLHIHSQASQSGDSSLQDAHSNLCKIQSGSWQQAQFPGSKTKQA